MEEGTSLASPYTASSSPDCKPSVQVASPSYSSDEEGVASTKQDGGGGSLHHDALLLSDWSGPLNDSQVPQSDDRSLLPSKVGAMSHRQWHRQCRSFCS